MLAIFCRISRSSDTEVFFFAPGKVGKGLSHAGWSGDIGGVFKGLRWALAISLLVNPSIFASECTHSRGPRKQIAPTAQVFLLSLRDRHSEGILCLDHHLSDRIRLELHRVLLAVFALVLPYRLLVAACCLHLLYHFHNILVVGDSLDLAAGIHSLSRHHSCPGIHHHNPARTRHCCNHHTRIHPAGIDHIAAEDTVEAVIECSFVEDLVSEPLFRCMGVAVVDSSPDRMPL